MSNKSEYYDQAYIKKIQKITDVKDKYGELIYTGPKIERKSADLGFHMSSTTFSRVRLGNKRDVTPKNIILFVIIFYEDFHEDKKLSYSLKEYLPSLNEINDLLKIIDENYDLEILTRGIHKFYPKDPKTNADFLKQAKKLCDELIKNSSIKPGQVSEELRENYLTYIYNQVARLTLKDVSGETGAGIELNAVYTALLTKENESISMRTARRERRESRIISVVEQLNSHRLLVLLGDAGSGKSTFASFVALCMAGDMRQVEGGASLKRLTDPLDGKPQTWNHGKLIPVRVDLGHFAASGILPASENNASTAHIWAFIEAELKREKDCKNIIGEFAPILKKDLKTKGGIIFFDGLDQVPEDHRKQICSAIEDFSREKEFCSCRIVVTSRPYAYEGQWRLNGFADVTLAPFTSEQIEYFVRHWYCDENDNARADSLLAEVFEKEGLRELAERPLLLTLMAILHKGLKEHDKNRLPEKRELLYSELTELLLQRWEKRLEIRDPKTNDVICQNGLKDFLNATPVKVRAVLEKLAYEVHEEHNIDINTADIDIDRLIGAFIKLENTSINKEQLIVYLSNRLGLLIPSTKPDAYTFLHRSFQEYLAGCHLATDATGYPERLSSLIRNKPVKWREVALFAGANAAKRGIFNLWALVDALSLESESEDGDACYWGAHIATQAVIECVEDLRKAKESKLTKPKIDYLRMPLLDIVEGNYFPAKERILAGKNLSILDDPRFNPDLWYLPSDEMLGFVHIPAGKFLMGNNYKDEKADRKNEDPQHEVELSEFWISKYPVTVAQFRVFTDAKKYEFERWEWNENKIPSNPIVGVTWHNAQEYTKWLNQQLHQYAEKQTKTGTKNSLWQGLADDKFCLTLPSEAEWEKSARGTDGRTYPWGNEFDFEKVNSNETQIGSPSVVGCFPAGTNGLFDMSGNIWEWTRSIYGRLDKAKNEIINIFYYPYSPNDGREEISEDAELARSFRGGSYSNVARYVRCANRGWHDPSLGYKNFGFRVAVVSASVKTNK